MTGDNMTDYIKLQKGKLDFIGIHTNPTQKGYLSIESIDAKLIMKTGRLDFDGTIPKLIFNNSAIRKIENGALDSILSITGGRLNLVFDYKDTNIDCDETPNYEEEMIDLSETFRGSNLLQEIIIEVETNLPVCINSCFLNCHNLKKANLDYCQIYKADYAFDNCVSLETAEVSVFYCSGLKGMFRNCIHLQNINVKSCFVDSHDFSDCKDVSECFWNCMSLERIDLSGIECIWDYIKDFRRVFAGCVSLKSVLFPAWQLDTPQNQLLLDDMFAFCMKLENIRFWKGFDIKAVPSNIRNEMFLHCDALKEENIL